MWKIQSWGLSHLLCLQRRSSISYLTERVQRALSRRRLYDSILEKEIHAEMWLHALTSIRFPDSKSTMVQDYPLPTTGSSHQKIFTASCIQVVVCYWHSHWAQKVPSTWNVLANRSRSYPVDSLLALSLVYDIRHRQRLCSTCFAKRLRIAAFM